MSDSPRVAEQERLWFRNVMQFLRLITLCARDAQPCRSSKCAALQAYNALSEWHCKAPRCPNHIPQGLKHQDKHVAGAHRSPSYNATRLFATTGIALLFGSVFWDIGSRRWIIHHKSLLGFLVILGPSNKGAYEGLLGLHRWQALPTVSPIVTFRYLL